MTKTVGIVIASLVCSFMLFVLVLVGLGVSAHNHEVSLRNLFNAQQQANESSFDKMWKVLQQQTGIASAERDSFRKTYVEIMNSTQGVAGNGQLASFFTQAKIDISPDLYRKLMTSIEAQREAFHQDQQHLLTIQQQHTDVLTRLPSSLFVGWRQPLQAKIVTSSRTSEAFEAGQDNNVDLFEKSTTNPEK